MHNHRSHMESGVRGMRLKRALGYLVFRWPQREQNSRVWIRTKAEAPFWCIPVSFVETQLQLLHRVKSRHGELGASVFWAGLRSHNFNRGNWYSVPPGSQNRTWTQASHPYQHVATWTVERPSIQPGLAWGGSRDRRAVSRQNPKKACPVEV